MNLKYACAIFDSPYSSDTKRVSKVREKENITFPLTLPTTQIAIHLASLKLNIRVDLFNLVNVQAYV